MRAIFCLLLTFILLGSLFAFGGVAYAFDPDTDLSNADASFWGEDAGDNSGCSVATAGDVNGDGYDDFLIGAYWDDEGGSAAGQTYLLFGTPPPNPPSVGGTAYPINKLAILAPWIALFAAIMVGASLVWLRRRRAQT